MANRLVTFGEPGPEGPPGQVTLPEGRGILGHASGAFFSTPIPSPSIDPLYRQALRVQANGTLAFEPIPTLPMPTNKPGAHGLFVMFDETNGYVLGQPDPWFEGYSDGVVTIEDGMPIVYSWDGMQDYSVFQLQGGLPTWAPLFFAEGLVYAFSDGSSQPLIGPVGGALTFVNEDGSTNMITLGYGLQYNVNDLQVNTSQVAALSGGTITAANSRGKTWINSFLLHNNTTVNVTSTSYVSVGVLNLGALSIGDRIVADCQYNRSSSGNAPYVLEISTSATPGSSIVASSPTLYSLAAGGAWTASVSWTVTSNLNHYLHLRTGKGASGDANWVITDKRLNAEIYRT